MKRMAGRWIAMAMTLLLVAALAACGGKKNEESAEGGLSDEAKGRVGYYKLAAMDSNDESTDGAIFEASGVQTFLVLNEDASGVLVMFGMEIGITWTESVLVAEGEETPYTYADGEITLESGDTVLRFVHAGEPGEAPQVEGAAQEAGSES